MSKMKKCKTCGTDIASSAKVCPSCGAKNKKPFYAKWWFWVIIALVVFAVVGGQGASDKPATNSNPSDEQATTKTEETVTKVGDKKAEEIKDVYLLGEIAELGKVSIQVTNLERNSGSEYDAPKSGYEYAVVTLAIKNTSDKTQSYNVYNFSMKNANGQIENQAFSTIANDTSLNSGELAPGGIVTGSIVFETPLDDNQLKLLYGDNIFTDKDIIFDVCNSVESFELMQGEKVSIDSSLPGIGEVVEFKNMNVTVERIERSSGDDWNKPKEGNEYVIVYITLENTGDKTENYNPFDFKLQNSTGTRLDQTMTTIDSDTAMSSGELASGGKFTASVTFEAPTGDTELGLIYEPNWLIGDNTMISLK